MEGSGPTLQEVLLGAEESALALSARAVEAFNDRCAITEAECADLHYDACQSRLPAGECTSEDLLDECIQGACGMVRDFNHAVVRVPASLADGEDLNPTDLNVIESACYSLALESSLISEYEEAQRNGAVYTYFGSWTGVFRFYPGIAYSTCGGYDPRIRPWFVGASSGPKDVVIVLDISGSMSVNGRLQLAKDATKSVLATMAIDTYVNIVLFSDMARVITTPTELLLQATEANKALLEGLVDELEAETTTNFEQALTKTFDVLDASRAAGTGHTSSCSTAVLLLTDGYITQGLDAAGVVGLVEDRNSDINAEIFSFALGPEADQDTAKTIACNTGGIFQIVEDGGDLAAAMSFYYRYYATGLGTNMGYTARTDLYNFSTGGDLGFTLAAPAYNTAFNPPAFLGVAGVDFKVSTITDQGFSVDELLDELLGGERMCPEFNLTECELQAFRGSISVDSVCPDSCQPVNTTLEPVRCMEDAEYPSNLWENTDLMGLTYTERTCCGAEYDQDFANVTCEDPFLTGFGGDVASEGSTEFPIWAGILAGVVLLTAARALCKFKLGWRPCAARSAPKQAGRAQSNLTRDPEAPAADSGASSPAPAVGPLGLPVRASSKTAVAPGPGDQGSQASEVKDGSGDLDRHRLSSASLEGAREIGRGTTSSNSGESSQGPPSAVALGPGDFWGSDSKALAPPPVVAAGTPPPSVGVAAAGPSPPATPDEKGRGDGGRAAADKGPDRQLSSVSLEEGQARRHNTEKSPASSLSSAPMALAFLDLAGGSDSLARATPVVTAGTPLPSGGVAAAAPPSPATPGEKRHRKDRRGAVENKGCTPA